MMPDASLERTYEGKKEMLLMENVEDKEYLTDLFKAIYDELAAPKPKKKMRGREPFCFGRLAVSPVNL